VPHHRALHLTTCLSLQLSSLGIPEQCMVFTHVTMQSEKYVCVRETGATNNVVIVDMANPTAPVRRPITADSTILAPSSKTLALKAVAGAEGGAQGDQLQVFNLDTKQKLKSHLNPEKVQFWAWLNDTTIGMVTDKTVFHWNMEVRPATCSSCAQHLRQSHQLRSWWTACPFQNERACRDLSRP
jgi:clathrin heavy chain